MDKKDIYEHLAKIYLDASSKKKKKAKPFTFQQHKVVVLLLVLFISVGAIYFGNVVKGMAYHKEIALFLSESPTKINFNFDPAKKEIFSLNLNKLNLNRYNVLGFSVKNINFEEKLSLRIEFVNVFKEKSEVYIKDIPRNWGDFKINLADFKHIHDWSEMATLSFCVEEWNAKSKKGVVYIDNIRLLK
ncbi:MAG: hypothetical protein HY761_07600 [Candidatus Omnitrophica bacterium]|nr:hypothetical protein [Candidatus Omnitrophota bacterium]